MNSTLSAQDMASALQFYTEIGWDEPMENFAQDRLTPAVAVVPVLSQDKPKNAPREMLGAAEAMSPASDLAAAAQNLEELKKAIAEFDGLAIRKTATHSVFADGNPNAKVMIVGEVPDADDDKSGVAFSPAGEAGQLLDKMMGAIGLNRGESVYLTHVLNWRPPGGRSPTAAEIDLSLPFLKKHIALVKPQFLLFFGALPAKALLGRSETMTKLRGQWFEYQGIPCLVTYPPSFLIKSPAKKREVWDDLQDFQKKSAAF
ncbi:MAG TPA: uracil-DNA glycosylase [Alphaproteobacteria bacterium]|nr:uracil-DNA glycosylase [Alphaproteobacteria bacterium]